MFGLLVIALVSIDAADTGAPRVSTVGMSNGIEQLVLPGSELEVKPRDDDRIPIVMRIAGSFPHGTDFRYDIVYYGLEPGRFDLTDFLRRKDGSSTDDLPPLLVEVTPVLPPGQIQPNRLQSESSPVLGGYRLLLLVAGAVWVVGLLAILFIGRRRRLAAGGGERQPLTLADRLRPAVEDAIAGRLSQSEQAALERLLLAFWRTRLDLDELNAADAIRALREHEEAGGLLRQLELWLHRPGQNDAVDVAALLKPYREVSADVIH